MSESNHAQKWLRVIDTFEDMPEDNDSYGDQDPHYVYDDECVDHRGLFWKDHSEDVLNLLSLPVVGHLNKEKLLLFVLKAAALSKRIDVFRVSDSCTVVRYSTKHCWGHSHDNLAIVLRLVPGKNSFEIQLKDTSSDNDDVTEDEWKACLGLDVPNEMCMWTQEGPALYRLMRDTAAKFLDEKVVAKGFPRILRIEKLSDDARVTIGKHWVKMQMSPFHSVPNMFIDEAQMNRALAYVTNEPCKWKEYLWKVPVVFRTKGRLLDNVPKRLRILHFLKLLLAEAYHDKDDKFKLYTVECKEYDLFQGGHGNTTTAYGIHNKELGTFALLGPCDLETPQWDWTPSYEWKPTNVYKQEGANITFAKFSFNFIPSTTLKLSCFWSMEGRELCRDMATLMDHWKFTKFIK